MQVRSEIEKREWLFTDDFEDVRQPVFEFRLTYQGLLLGSDKEGHRSDHKQQIRQYFHKQLVTLWKTKRPLCDKTTIEKINTTFKIGEKRVIPLATRAQGHVCALDIILLRRDFRTVINSGDLDNRIKTLIDAMRIPKANEVCDGPEDPLCCVMEDDSLVAEIRVLADFLYASPEQVIQSPNISPFSGEPKAKENHVLALIHVSIKSTTTGSEDFPQTSIVGLWQ